MMALIFLHIILISFFAILWTSGNGSQNWFGKFGRQAIQEDVAGGRRANKPEKCGMSLTLMTLEEPRISTISDHSQRPIETNTPVSNTLSLKY